MVCWSYLFIIITAYLSKWRIGLHARHLQAALSAAAADISVQVFKPISLISIVFFIIVFFILLY